MSWSIIKSRTTINEIVIKPLAKIAFIELGFTEAASAADAKIKKKILDLVILYSLLT